MANILRLHRNGAVGFTDWLGLFGIAAELFGESKQRWRGFAGGNCVILFPAAWHLRSSEDTVVERVIASLGLLGAGRFAVGSIAWLDLFGII